MWCCGAQFSGGQLALSLVAYALPLVSLFSPRPFLTCSGSLVFVSLYAILR